MGKKKKIKNFNGLEAAFEEIKQKKEADYTIFREKVMQARDSIFDMLGKPPYIAYDESGKLIYRYKTEQIVRYIKKKYGAKEISFAESLDYYQNRHFTLNPIDPLYTITDRLTIDYLVATLLLPPLYEKESKFVAKKNGGLVYLSGENGFCDDYAFDGNWKGYMFLWEYEIYILTGKWPNWIKEIL